MGLSVAAPSFAQMSGMTMPMPAAPKPVPHRKAPPPRATPPRSAVPPATKAEPAMMPDMPGMAMAGPTAPADAPLAGTALPAGDAPPPPAPTDHYADRRFDPTAMTVARTRMMGEEGGGGSQHEVLFNLAELQVHDGRAGYRWDGEAWFGRDLSRIVVKSEGEGGADGLDAAEVQALYSRAIGPYFNAQAGIRHDIAPTPARTYATIGVEGLAPYEVEIEAALFVSTRGELVGRIEGWHDARITQRLVLQPRVELNLAAQDLRGTRIGAGLSDAELGLRLRYEIAREFAPYVGVSYEAKTGRTADDARAAGRDVAATVLVIGTRFWF